jgi:hypothetical protein
VSRQRASLVFSWHHSSSVPSSVRRARRRTVDVARPGARRTVTSGGSSTISVVAATSSIDSPG